MCARRLALLAAAALGAALPGAVPAAAEAAGPRVQAMVVGRTGKVVAGARWVRLDGFRHGRCRLARGLPIGVLHAFRLPFRTRGECSSLYVFQIGRSRAGGRQGWVYKVGRRSGTAGASDPSGPFGSGRIRSGRRVVWFWCRSALRCQRTLALSSRRRVRRGGRLRVRVRGYDDFGRGRPIGGALVTVGRSRARTDRHGLAVVRMPRSRGVHRLRAYRTGLVPAFPIGVRAL